MTQGVGQEKVWVINSQHMCYLLMIALSTLCLPGVVENHKEAKQQRAAQQPYDIARMAAESRVLANEDMSAIALRRVNQNCTPIVNIETNTPAHLSESTSVLGASSGTPLSPNTTVCNFFGETGEVDSRGFITSIARVATADLEEYRRLFGILSETPTQ